MAHLNLAENQGYILQSKLKEKSASQRIVITGVGLTSPNG